MSNQYTGRGQTVIAEQFNAETTPWPKGITEEDGLTGEKVYTIVTPTGEQSVEDGDYILLDGEEGEFPDVVPYDEFIDTFIPVPEI